MEKKIFIIAFLMVFLVSSGALAGNDNTGTSCANFLKIGVGPRAEAMGGSFVAMANDWTALYWNPAGIARLEHTEIGFARTDWIVDITHSFFGAVYSPGAKWGTFGFSINYLDMGEMERTTPAEPEGTGSYFNSSDLAVGVAYARNLTDRFSVGVKGKFVSETIGFSSANAIAIDVGTQFITGFQGIRLGMSISNFGGKMLMMGTEQMVKADADELIDGSPMEKSRLETENWPLPMIFRLGLSFEALKNDQMQFTVNMDFNDPRDINPYGSFGGEYGWNNMVFLRGGLIYRPKDFDVTLLEEKEELALNYEIKYAFGGGLLLSVPGTSVKMRLDYAYTDLGILTNSHRFSFSMLF